MCAKQSGISVDYSVEYTVVTTLLREAAARIEDALRLLEPAFNTIDPTPSGVDIHAGLPSAQRLAPSRADVMRRLMGAPDY